MKNLRCIETFPIQNNDLIFFKSHDFFWFFNCLQSIWLVTPFTQVSCFCLEFFCNGVQSCCVVVNLNMFTYCVFYMHFFNFVCSNCHLLASMFASYLQRHGSMFYKFSIKMCLMRESIVVSITPFSILYVLFVLFVSQNTSCIFCFLSKLSFVELFDSSLQFFFLFSFCFACFRFLILKMVKDLHPQ